MFNEKEHIIKMQPFVKKLVDYLNTKEVTYVDNDGELDNVIFFKDEKEVKISYHCFYRFSGCAVIYKNISDKKGQPLLEITPLTDDMFFNIYWKNILDYLFKL